MGDEEPAAPRYTHQAPSSTPAASFIYVNVHAQLALEPPSCPSGKTPIDPTPQEQVLTRIVSHIICLNYQGSVRNTVRVARHWALGWEEWLPHWPAWVPWHSFLHPITAGAPWCLARNMALVLSRVKWDFPQDVAVVSGLDPLGPGSSPASLCAASFPRAPSSQSHSA